MVHTRLLIPLVLMAGALAAIGAGRLPAIAAQTVPTSPRSDPGGVPLLGALVRARLTGALLTRDYRTDWQFADGKGAKVARGTRGTSRTGNRTERSGGE